MHCCELFYIQMPLSIKYRPLAKLLFTTRAINDIIYSYSQERSTALKIRTEISDIDEIVIRCRERNETIKQLESAIDIAVKCGEDIALTKNTTEYFVPRNNILFFESCENKVYAHTVDEIYKAPYKLFELELMMPPSFVRISKSAIVNIMHIDSLRRELVGNGELTFKGCEKRIYFSRNYYKLLQYKIEEMRFKK